ncbi:MAG: hypothetical protein D6689_12090 [Deltaproteobacteria bacterium]|nr:MAG: hypothetical protein D6689_12090 [Deltaproteobacteria bacterium]
MKTYARIARRRIEAALRLHLDGRRPVEPVMNDPIELPAEIIDLATGPYELRFPDLAAKRRKREK